MKLNQDLVDLDFNQLHGCHFSEHHEGLQINLCFDEFYQKQSNEQQDDLYFFY
jgi:hypothetical protein